MSKTSIKTPPEDKANRSFVKGTVRKALDTIKAVKESMSEPDRKDPYVNRRPVLKPTAPKKQIPHIELLRFRRPNQRKRRKLNRQSNPRGFKFRYA